MWRRALVSLLLSSVALGRSNVALAIDYHEPVVPSRFLIAASPAPQPAASGVVRLLREGAGGRDSVAAGGFSRSADVQDAGPPEAGGVDVGWLRTGAPGASRVVSHDQWSEGGGCAFRSWASC